MRAVRGVKMFKMKYTCEPCNVILRKYGPLPKEDPRCSGCGRGMWLEGVI